MKTTTFLRLAMQSEALNLLLKGLSEGQIRHRLLTNKWAIFEHIAHLGRYQVVFLDRMQQIAEGNVPIFTRYIAQEDDELAQ